MASGSCGEQNENNVGTQSRSTGQAPRVSALCVCHGEMSPWRLWNIEDILSWRLEFWQMLLAKTCFQWGSREFCHWFQREQIWAIAETSPKLTLRTQKRLTSSFGLRGRQPGWLERFILKDNIKIIDCTLAARMFGKIMALAPVICGQHPKPRC